jgi:hypothetical protein
LPTVSVAMKLRCKRMLEILCLHIIGVLTTAGEGEGCVAIRLA